MLDDSFDARFAGARALHESRKWHEAELAYRALHVERPDDPAAALNLGVMMYVQGRHDQAMEMYDEAIRLKPDYALAYNSRGAAMSAMRWDGALESFAKAAELAPDDTYILGNYGRCLIGLERYEEAEAPLRRCVALEPNAAGPLLNLAGCIWGEGRFAAAEDVYRLALKLDPSSADAHRNLGVVCLQRGAYAEGWLHYDWRWTADRLDRQHQNLPEWSGGAVDGALLVWGEQGIGDQVLQLSMLRDLVRRGLSVVWECDPRLVPLVRRSYPTIRCIPRFGFVPRDVSAQIAGGSLGRFLRNDVADFPIDLAYLRADSTRVAALRQDLQEKNPDRRLVGISWASTGSTFGPLKSSRLADWSKLLFLPGHHFVNLQHGEVSLEAMVAFNLTHPTIDVFDDIEGLAALICACDEVITISNVVGHLAGALGVPTTILVPSMAQLFWYYGRDGDTMPWYPSVTLVRKRRGQPWAEVITAIAKEASA